MDLRYSAVPIVLLLATSCISAHAAERPNTGVVAPVIADTGTARTTASTGRATPDTARIQALVRSTAPAQPLQITFTWSMQDRDYKFAGRGVVRMQGPYHARLDLFGPQDIQVLRASLNDDSLDFVYAGPRVPLPPAAFMWAALGVFRTPVAGEPASLTNDDKDLAFGYDAAPAHWRFRADSTTLKSAEWQGDDGGRRTVELSGPFRFGRPTKAVYRDWREFRELTFNVTDVEKVDAFAPDIWNVSNH